MFTKNGPFTITALKVYCNAALISLCGWYISIQDVIVIFSELLSIFCVCMIFSNDDGHPLYHDQKEWPLLELDRHLPIF